MRLLLDTNEYIFALARLHPPSERLLRLAWHRDDIAAVHSSLVPEFQWVVYGSARFTVLPEARLPQGLVRKYQAAGLLNEADARIGAFAEWVGADFLVSENWHFLRDLRTAAYRVVDAAEMLAVLEGGASC